jgi:pyrroline-5-carboxylate reductase
MGTYFGILERTTDWLSSKGMEETKARSYLTPLFSGLAHVAGRSLEDSYVKLRQEFSAKGGTEMLITALDRVLERIKR